VITGSVNRGSGRCIDITHPGPPVVGQVGERRRIRIDPDRFRTLAHHDERIAPEILQAHSVTPISDALDESPPKPVLREETHDFLLRLHDFGRGQLMPAGKAGDRLKGLVRIAQRLDDSCRAEHGESVDRRTFRAIATLDEHCREEPIAVVKVMQQHFGSFRVLPDAPPKGRDETAEHRAMCQ